MGHCKPGTAENTAPNGKVWKRALTSSKILAKVAPAKSVCHSVGDYTSTTENGQHSPRGSKGISRTGPAPVESTQISPYGNPMHTRVGSPLASPRGAA
eukprot:1821032-Prymnesium_polylepis.3